LGNIIRDCEYNQDKILFNCTKNYLENFIIKRNLYCQQYCPLECDSIDYTFVLRNYSSNLTQLFIYFNQLKYLHKFENPKSEPYNLISNIGGILSLFLGVSLVSVFEAGQLIFQILTVLLNKNKQEEKDEKPTTNIEKSIDEEIKELKQEILNEIIIQLMNYGKANKFEKDEITEENSINSINDSKKKPSTLGETTMSTKSEMDFIKVANLMPNMEETIMKVKDEIVVEKNTISQHRQYDTETKMDVEKSLIPSILGGTNNKIKSELEFMEKKILMTSIEEKIMKKKDEIDCSIFQQRQDDTDQNVDIPDILGGTINKIKSEMAYIKNSLAKPSIMDEAKMRLENEINNIKGSIPKQSSMDEAKMRLENEINNIKGAVSKPSIIMDEAKDE